MGTSLLRHARRPPLAAALLWALASNCHAGVQPLDDTALMQVHGAGLDELLVGRLDPDSRGGRHSSTSDTSGTRHGKDTASTQHQDDGDDAADGVATRTAAMLAALEMQINQGQRTATLAVQTVRTVTQLGGTLIALTPVSTMLPIGFFGLSTLPATLKQH